MGRGARSPRNAAGFPKRFGTGEYRRSPPAGGKARAGLDEAGNRQQATGNRRKKPCPQRNARSLS
jgi:hypothetical protein